MTDIKNINAGQAVVQLLADNSKLSSTLKDSTSRCQRFADACTNLGNRLAIVGTKMLEPFREATTIFASFNDEMRTVAAVTSASLSAFTTLSDQAKHLGETTSFTAKQVAEGMASLGRMGLSSGNISSSIESMMALSQATGTDLASASEIAANNMAVFRINASQSSHVADVLAITANSSAQTLADLGEALKTAAPFAKQAGQDIQQTSAALGVLANMGIRGSMAGTSLAKTYKRLASPEVRNYLRDMFNIDPTDGNGRLRDTASVLAEIGRAVSTLGSAEQITALEKIFDAQGALGGGILSVNTEAIDKLIDKYKQLDGYAKKAAEQQEGGIGGTLRTLSSAAECVNIAIGEAIADAIQPLLGCLADFLLGVKDFINAHPTLVKAIAAIAAALAAIGIALASVGATIGMVSGVKMAVVALSASFTAHSAAATAAATSVGIFSKALNLLIAHPVIAGLAGLTAILALICALTNRSARNLQELDVEKSQSLSKKLSNQRKEFEKTLKNTSEDEAQAKRVEFLKTQIRTRNKQISTNASDADAIVKNAAWYKFNKSSAIAAANALHKENERLDMENQTDLEEIQMIQKAANVAAGARAGMVQARAKADEADKTIADIIDRHTTGIEKEIKALEDEKKAYIEALKAKIEYQKASGQDYSGAQSQLAKADRLYAALITDTYDRANSGKYIDIEGDMGKRAAERTQRRESGVEDARLERIRMTRGNDFYVMELNRLIANANISLTDSAKLYKQTLQDAKAETSEGGREISPAEAHRLSMIDEERLRYEKMLDSLQQKMDAATINAEDSFSAKMLTYASFNASQISQFAFGQQTSDAAETRKNTARTNDILTCIYNNMNNFNLGLA